MSFDAVALIIINLSQSRKAAKSKGKILWIFLIFIVLLDNYEIILIL